MNRQDRNMAWAAATATFFAGVIVYLEGTGVNILGLILLWFMITGVIYWLYEVIDFAIGDHEKRERFHYHGGNWGHAHKYATEFHDHPFNDERIRLFTDAHDDNPRIIDLRN